MKRGRRPGGVDTRAEIIEAARAEFAEQGYDNATLRGVARRAHVDPALIHHYFSDKPQLFEETMEITDSHTLSDTMEKLFDVTPREELGAEIVRAFLILMESESNQESFVVMARAAMSLEEATASARTYLGREILVKMIQRLNTNCPDAELRATLITALIFGIGLGRFVTHSPVLENASIEQITAFAGPMVQVNLEGRQVIGDESRDQSKVREIIRLAS